MAAAPTHGFCAVSLVIMLAASFFSGTATAQLSVSFYAKTCPSVYETVRAGVRAAIKEEARWGASILRLFFHDCFVNGCDGGVLLDGEDGEKAAEPNLTLRGFELIDSIKSQVDGACGGGAVVSCSDILAIAARDSVVELGGPTYEVPLGRRDTNTTFKDDANVLPPPSADLDELVDRFGKKGFSMREMVALSGAHTVGFARCSVFRERIYNETNIDPDFATIRRRICPSTEGEEDNNLAPLDHLSPNRFGSDYFKALLNRKGLLHSDQVLFNGGSADDIVGTYAGDRNAFLVDFANAMVKLGNLSPLTGDQGEVRANCRMVNYN
ncbi:unnamed protein product [Victoria cruziana]